MNDLRTVQGMYFEEFEVGQSAVSVGRTITEADVVRFAGLTGDFNSIHTDADYAAGHSFGQRVAHGLLVQSIAVGLATRLGVIEGTVIAFRDMTCKFSLPVYFNDTIRLKIEIKELKALPRLGGGSVTMKYSILNQNDKAVQRGEWNMLVMSSPA